MASSKSIAPIIGTFIRPSRPSHICSPCLRQQQRSIQKSAAKIPIPKPTPFVPDVQTFFTLIGRGLSAQASKFTWEKLFTLSSDELREIGVEPARTRRYLLRWRQKFRNGQYGVGGDLQHVKDGAAELRVLEVPSLHGKQDGAEYFSVTHTPGKTRLILNVPEGVTSYDKLLKPGQSSKDLKKPRDYSLKEGHVITGPYALPIVGDGTVARVKITEGMWEDRLGVKVYGGERRRAATLHKMGVEAHRKAIGTAR